MLTLVATPIGRMDEITLRSLEVLKNADVIVCESTKETSKLLKHHNIKAKQYEVLNEHSQASDVVKLTELCKNQQVALVSDCGTPGFCDPGFQLVESCRKENIPVQSALGPSSLMGLLSLSSQRLFQFYFRGFIPAETLKRQQEWKSLRLVKEPIVLMDTPYRLSKMLDECCEHFASRRMLITLNLSQENELVFEGLPSEIRKKVTESNQAKAEFMILIYAV